MVAYKEQKQTQSIVMSCLLSYQLLFSDQWKLPVKLVLNSTWLSMLTIQEHGFALHKGASFRDALCLCYCWQPTLLPLTCVCGNTFSIEHVLSCPCGGYPSIRHNELRDITATLLTEVCHGVGIEPCLQPYLASF